MSDSPAVTLRGQRSDDWDALFGMLNHDAAARLSEDAPFLSEDDFRERYMNVADGVHRLIGEIALPSGRKRLVGWASVAANPRRRRRCGVLQLVVHPDHYGAPEETAFATQVVQFVDRWLPLHRLELVLYADDARMIALAERCGFVCEATLRRYVVRDGAPQDACLAGRLHGARQGEAAPAAQEPPEEQSPEERPEPLEDVFVRGAEAEDWEDVAEMLESGGDVLSNTLQLPYMSRDAVRDRLENVPEGLKLLVAEAADERVVGQLGVHLETGRRAHSARLGMMVHADYQGQGVGSALMAAAVELCEQWLNVSRIALEVFTDNAAGIALYRKFGFEIEGTLRDYAFRDGRWVDSYVMARIRDEEEA